MDINSLIEAINDRSVVTGLTHDLYRYPARFSPTFARTAIDLFTEPGDTVLDPFMGGSTSIVEAMAMGRNAVGVDINQLSIFLARVKTLILDDGQLASLKAWADLTIPELSPQKPVVRHQHYLDLGYQANMPWRFRKFAEQAINSAADLLDHELLPVARCIVLKAIQWAVDCKKAFPSAGQFRAKLAKDVEVVTDGLRSLRQRVAALGTPPAVVEFHNRSTDTIDTIQSDLIRTNPPKLVVTSPPYPGVHVLYHRWQVLGRRETAAPYWITESNDGQGASYYTFCGRRRKDGDEKYFQRLLACFQGIRKVVRKGCVVAQLVGFSQPDAQLPLYMDAMSDAGFDELDLASDSRLGTDAFWRAVPNRKWYAGLRTQTKQSKEILLLHRSS
jgi:hypothetical protein